MRFLPALLLAACATSSTLHPTPTGGPRGLHADEHLDAARAQAEVGRRENSWPDVHGAGVPGSLDYGTAGVPWVRAWDTSADHERLAAIHRSEAMAIEAEYQDACGSRPFAEVSVSPLQRYGYAGWNTSSGVVVYLTSEAGPPARLLADLRCHRAWMMLKADANMETCPLDLPGLKVDARGDATGITLSLAVKPELIEELQRRAAHDLEHKR